MIDLNSLGKESAYLCIISYDPPSDKPSNATIRQPYAILLSFSRNPNSKVDQSECPSKDNTSNKENLFFLHLKSYQQTMQAIKINNHNSYV